VEYVKQSQDHYVNQALLTILVVKSVSQVHVHQAVISVLQQENVNQLQYVHQAPLL
jgi:hypothetical protein